MNDLTLSSLQSLRETARNASTPRNWTQGEDVERFSYEEGDRVIVEKVKLDTLRAGDGNGSHEVASSIHHDRDLRFLVESDPDTVLDLIALVERQHSALRAAVEKLTGDEPEQIGEAIRRAEEGSA